MQPIITKTDTTLVPELVTKIMQGNHVAVRRNDCKWHRTQRLSREHSNC